MNGWNGIGAVAPIDAEATLGPGTDGNIDFQVLGRKMTEGFDNSFRVTFDNDSGCNFSGHADPLLFDKKEAAIIVEPACWRF